MCVNCHLLQYLKTGLVIAGLTVHFLVFNCHSFKLFEYVDLRKAFFIFRKGKFLFKLA